MRIRFVVIAAWAGALLLVTAPGKGASAQPLRVGATPNVHSALIYLAESEGFFKKQSIDVVVKEYELGPDAVGDLLSGHLDFATAAEFVFVLQSFQKPDIKMLSTICLVSNHDIVVRKDRGIAEPQDLKGKRIAIARGTSAEFFLYNYLIFNRIPAESVQVVHQTPLETVKAIADGTIDAAISWAPYPAEMMKQLGANGVRWPAQSGQHSYMALYARDRLLKKQPKVAERFLAALVEAESFLAANPDKASTIVRRRLKADLDSFLEAWSRSSVKIQLTQDLLVLMEREAKWAIRKNIVEKKEMPNYLDLLYLDALDKMKPEAVSIVH
jgi:NitT/TauT family transport system substrate-binding protein